MIKLFHISVAIVVVFCAYTISQITDIPERDNKAFAIVIDPVTGEEIKISVSDNTEPVFTRSSTKDSPISWTSMPCRNNQTGAYYESEILSFEEVEYNLQVVGFTPENAHIMAAIAHKESGHQLECIGDESLITGKWTYSYGIFQIRGLNAETGKGTCRDIEVLVGDIRKQAQCAFEISGGGTNFRPWSMYLNGKYRESL